MRLLRYFTYLLLTVLIAQTGGWGSGSTAVAQEKEKACLDCHPSYLEDLSGDFNHQPFAEGDCYACHNNHGFGRTFELAGSIIDLCTACHAAMTELPDESLHYPVTEDSSCLECHLPHSADNKKFLKKPGGQLCLECHDSPSEATGVVHQPYADTLCVDCHNPHGSLFGSFLQLPTGYVCQSCHENILADFSPDQLHTGNEISSCEHCHSGHAASAEYLLHAEAGELCLGCHSAIFPDTLAVPHSALVENDCLICHQPHFRKGTNSLTAQQPDLCLTCHDDIAEMLDREYLHGPAAEECSICHDPHRQFTGGQQPELCAGCHEIEDEEFLQRHGNIPAQSCAGCHNPHGSTSEKLLRNSLHAPFAERECEVCHQPGIEPDQIAELNICLECHDLPEPSDSHSPEQIKDRNCLHCHQPHAAKTQSLLRSSWN